MRSIATTAKPEPVTVEPALKNAVMPAGTPLRLRSTVPLNPFVGVMIALYEVMAC